MKKMYIAPAMQVETVALTGMIAESLIINAEKQGDAALVRQENTWDIWGNADAEMEVEE